MLDNGRALWHTRALPNGIPLTHAFLCMLQWAVAPLHPPPLSCLQVLHLASGEELGYDRLCIATGGRPVRLPGLASNPAVLTLRDTDSVDALAARLCSARHVAVVGNGGIALELV